MDNLDETSGECEMKINQKKTKVVRIRKKEGSKITIKIDGVRLKQVQFSYLGSTVTADRKSHIEIRTHKILGKEAFGKNNDLLRGHWNSSI